MKHKLSWYQENIRNANYSIEREKNRAVTILKQLFVSKINYEFLQYQIECAKREKKPVFDQDKYKKKERENFVQQRLTGSGLKAFSQIDSVKFS